MKKYLKIILERFFTALLRAHYRDQVSNYKKTNMTVNSEGKLLLYDNKHTEYDCKGNPKEIKTGHFVANIRGVAEYEEVDNRTQLFFTASKIEFIEKHD